MATQTLLFIIPILAIFGALSWAQLFLQHYEHHSRIPKTQRILSAVGIATALTLFLLAITTTFLYLFLNEVLK